MFSTYSHPETKLCTKHVQENGTPRVLKGLSLSMCDAKELLNNNEEEE